MLIKIQQSGDIKAENILVSVNNSTISNSVKGVEANSQGGKVDIQGEVKGKQAIISKNVAGAYAGNTNDFFQNIKQTSKPNSTASSLKAEGSVLLDASEVKENVFGALALGKNEVNAQGIVEVQNNSRITKDIYGAFANSIDGNSQAQADVKITDSEVKGDIYGAYAKTEKGDANSQAQVLIDNSEIKGDIIAAYAESREKTASANGSVFLQNNAQLGDGKNIYAAFVENSNAIDAKGNVLLNNVKANNNSIYGVYAQSNDKKGDINLDGAITLVNSELKNSNIIGAYFDSNSGEENIKITSNIAIENSTAGNILGSQLTLDEKTKTVDTASNIFIGDGSKISGQVVGAYIDMKDLKKDIDFHSTNTITIAGKVDFDKKSEIFGQLYNKDENPNLNLNYDAMDKNTLKYSANPITISKLGNFDTYEFTINDLNKHLIHNGADASQSGIITVTDLFKNDIDPNTGKAAEVHISGIDAKLVKPDDRIILIDLRNADVLGDGTEFDVTELFANVDKAEADKVKVGFIRKAYVTYSLEKAINDDCSGDECLLEDSYGYTVVAKIKNKEPEFCELNPTHEDCVDPVDPPKPPVEPEFCELNPTHPSCDEGEFEVDEEELARLSSIYQARLATITTLNQGMNLLIDSAFRTLEPTKLGDIIPFAAIEGGKSRYKDNGKLTNKHLNFLVGAGYSWDESVFGWFFEYGRNKYDASNSFIDGKIKGNGKAYYQGVGLVGKSYFGNTYVDASIRYGRAKTKYNTNDVVNASGVSADFTNRQSYMGAHVGLGYKAEVQNNTFDTSIRGIYTTIGKNNRTIADEKFKFDRVNSTKLRVAEDYTYDVSKNVGLKAGLAYEYEFTAKAKGSVDGAKIKAQSLKGSTYVGSLGVALHPFNGGDKNKVIEIGGKGYLGKQKGASGNIQFTYNF